MRIHLPAETWAEIFGWLNRREFAQKMELLWDREFSPIAENWLHKWYRNVCLGPLRFTEEEAIINEGNAAWKMQKKKACLQKWAYGQIRRQICMQKCTRSDRKLYKRGPYMDVPIADVELPRNITSFHSICISHLDPTIINFLHQMGPLLSKGGVHLAIGKYEPLQPWYMYLEHDYQPALDRLLPAIRGDPLESLRINHISVLRLFKSYFPAVLNAAKMLFYSPGFCLNSFSRFVQQSMADWLFTPQDSPRKLLLYNHVNGKELADFIVEIRKRFLAPERRQNCAFFIRLSGTVEDSSAENAAVGEQLAVRNVVGGFVLISCHKINENKQKMANIEQELLDWNWNDKQRKLCICQPITINRNAADAEGVDVEFVEERPGTSQQSAAKRSHPDDDDGGVEEEEERPGTSGGEASTSKAGGAQKKKKFSNDPENKANVVDEETAAKSVRRSERIKKQQSKK